MTQIGSEIALAVESDPDGDTNVCNMGLWGIIMRGGVPTGAVLLGALNSWLGFRWGMVTVTLAFVVVLAYVIPRSNQLAARLEAVPTGGPES